MSVVPDAARPTVARGFRLQWEPAQQAHVLLYPEGMVKLNDSAGQILSRCDGRRTVTEIVADLEHTYRTSGLADDVRTFIAFALEKQWLELDREAQLDPLCDTARNPP
ncbi:MAG: pyrroloquinoline quinone biosynthesis peptide chaperone PqqD [Pseudomonadota bacterium]|nr:MAG: pyrroloquinoline quinone biosynthesis peptide chaperone PqqD [Pseudomonadota bacterium]